MKQTLYELIDNLTEDLQANKAIVKQITQELKNFVPPHKGRQSIYPWHIWATEPFKDHLINKYLEQNNRTIDHVRNAAEQYGKRKGLRVSIETAEDGRVKILFRHKDDPYKSAGGDSFNKRKNANKYYDWETWTKEPFREHTLIPRSAYLSFKTYANQQATARNLKIAISKPDQHQQVTIKFYRPNTKRPHVTPPNYLVNPEDWSLDTAEDDAAYFYSKQRKEQ